MQGSPIRAALFYVVTPNLAHGHGLGNGDDTLSLGLFLLALLFGTLSLSSQAFYLSRVDSPLSQAAQVVGFLPCHIQANRGPCAQ